MCTRWQKMAGARVHFLHYPAVTFISLFAKPTIYLIIIILGTQFRVSRFLYQLTLANHLTPETVKRIIIVV